MSTDHPNLSQHNHFKRFFKDINNLSISDITSDINVNPNSINCKYYDIPSFTKIKKLKKHLSIFPLNIASLSKHKDEIMTLFEMLDWNFDFIGLTETKIQNTSPTFNAELDGYKLFSTPTESEKGGAILFVKEHFISKRRSDLEKVSYKPKHLESVFIEICNKNKKNLVIGCIYRHPSMDLNLFNTDFLSPLLQILDKENKQLFLIGDFNINLMNINSNPDTASFFERISSSLFVPHIIFPTRCTTNSNTLIDNIFSNCNNFQDGISGNLTVAISDHLPQF